MHYDDFVMAEKLRKLTGRMVHCKGGGGSSGAVDYPSYMKTQHELWLGEIDSLIDSTSSPYIGMAAYDPSNDTAAMIQALNTFSAAVTALAYVTDVEAAMSAAQVKVDAICDDTFLNADIAAYAAILDQDINDEVLPQFQAGMRDINAVMTSAFVLGEAKIWARKTSEINKYASALRLEMKRQRNQMVMQATELMMNHMDKIVAFQQLVASMSLEAYRIKIVAHKEEVDANILLEKDDALFRFELYQYAGNMLAAIGGGTHTTAGDKPSTLQSVLGGAMSGAAVGAMVGGPMGAAVGGVIGGVGGLLM